MKRLIVLVLLGFVSALAQAKITVEISPSQLSIDRPFQLIITQTDSQNGGSIPNLMPLRQDFEILGTQRQASYSIINGQSQSSRQWIVSLKAKKTGVLTLPALEVGTEKTTPITINVSGTSQQQTRAFTTPQQKEVMLTTEVSHNKPYVNQQVIYTVKLYYSKRLLDADYKEPQVDNALMIPLGEAKVYQTPINAINYVVQEQNYAVFPQKSGSLTIKSPVFRALVYGLNTRAIQAQDNPLTLQVQPIPKGYKGKDWLPAKIIKLKQDYENNSIRLNQGSTLIRTITLEGVGIPAQLLPKLQFTDNDAFSVYPEYGAPKTEVKQGQLIGSTEIKVTYLFKKSGKVSIPELKLPWFNTETQKEEVASLPPRVFDITAEVLQEQKENIQPVKSSHDVSSIVLTHSPSSYNPLAWLVAFVFAFLWLVTLGLWVWQRPRGFVKKTSCKKSLDLLKKACLEGNAIKAREALLKWASRHWPDAEVSNLNELMQLAQGTSLKKQIHGLSEALYQKENKSTWCGEALYKSVLDENKKQVIRTNKSPLLPPLHPR